MITTKKWSTEPGGWIFRKDCKRNQKEHFEDMFSAMLSKHSCLTSVKCLERGGREIECQNK